MSTNAVQKPRDKHFTTILLAAQEEFATHGLKGARMQAIADRAGLPKANVHYYFQNKVSLYLAVLDNIIATWDDFFNDVSVNDDPAAALDTFIREKVRLSFENPTASRLFANEILQGAPYLTDYMSEVLRPWVNNRAKVIREWMNAGKMIASDPVLLIFMIWASTQHYADFQAQVLGILGRKEYDDDLISQVSDFTSQTILRGCGLEPPNNEAMAHQ
ncbi:MAG: TetR family transcriptional regulator [Gammaproteobacteria bacterium]|jgi:TetR/AcrR family transcriptional regulator|nr:TetR family transcriptional regulator [Gammaproteobacteria bacterium]MBT6582712.1 TetR family transcriptional regulator [Gammaproteobacteria bacterium]MBT6891486.1 TetR family transcriptional regulator [Gammaproteobacteria bacterium]MBT7877028.1 TetR family transcriptional regulator [Gammaproteobacteria bacterium]